MQGSAGVSQFFLTVPGRGECDYQPMHHGKSEICMTEVAALLWLECSLQMVKYSLQSLFLKQM